MLISNQTATNNKVLVVDDSNQFLFIMTTMLEMNDIKVEAVSAPLQAKKIIEENQFGLIILDYIMDNLDGINLAEHIRKTEINKKTKIVLLTTKKLIDPELKKINKLKLKYIQKPIVPSSFVTEIISMIGSRI